MVLRGVLGAGGDGGGEVGSGGRTKLLLDLMDPELEPDPREGALTDGTLGERSLCLVRGLGAEVTTLIARFLGWGEVFSGKGAHTSSFLSSSNMTPSPVGLTAVYS